MKKTATRIVVPNFATVAEEAAWWYQNRERHGKIMRTAIKSGEAQILTQEKLLARIEASKEKAGACGGLTDSRGGPHASPKAGRTKGSPLSDLYQISAA